MIDKMYIDSTILNALKEDMPLGDITTDNTITGGSVSKARLIAKQDMVLAGIDVSERVFKLVNEDIHFNKLAEDGAKIQKGDIIAEIEGDTAAMLKAERTALNFLQRLSGIATKTALFVDKVCDLPANVVDTRKTTPGLRYLEKYAVKVGGGQNHRFCLSDGVLIKDNHIQAAGGIKNAVSKIKGYIPHTIKIEVETETMEQVAEAVEAGADIIMLDNMSLERMKEAVEFINGRALVEASGNVTLERVRSIAETGVDIISVGGLTHSVEAADISMRFI